MTKPGLYTAISAFLLLLFLQTGCSTEQRGTRSADNATTVQTRRKQGVTVNLQYLDERMLYDGFGRRDNPFFDYQSNPLVVLKIWMRTETACRLRLVKVEFEYLGAKSRPLSRVELNRYWEDLLRNRNTSPGRYRSWSFNEITKIIDETVLSDVVELYPDEEYSGFLLFEGEKYRHGTARLVIPFYERSGKKLTELIFLIDI
jgi:hypothetical protein